jgi:uncharacterized protein
VNKEIKIIIPIILLTILLFAGGVMYANQIIENNKYSSTGKSIDMNFEKLEVMRTQEEQAQGLQNRTELCKNCGMLFVFDNNQVLSFWMKNTLLPIDIIYLDENNKVITLVEKPEMNITSKTYSSILPVKKALEILTIRREELNIKEGDTLKFDY